MGTHLRRILRCWALVRRRKLKNIARRKESSHRSCEDVRPPSPSRLFKRYLAQEFWWTFGDGRVVSTVFFLENIWVLWDKVEVSVGFPLSCKGCTEMPFWNGLFSFFSFCERRLELTEFGVWQKRQGVSQQGRFNIYMYTHTYICFYVWLIARKIVQKMKTFLGGEFLGDGWQLKDFLNFLAWGDDPIWTTTANIFSIMGWWKTTNSIWNFPVVIFYH